LARRHARGDWQLSGDQPRAGAWAEREGGVNALRTLGKVCLTADGTGEHRWRKEDEENFQRSTFNGWEGRSPYSYWGRFAVALICLENVSRRYEMGTETIHALRDVSLEIARGE